VKTIGVDLWGSQLRGNAPNQPTVMHGTKKAPPQRDLAELFASAYGKFADRCREIEEPGLAVIAIDERTGRAAGLVRILARVERHVAAIIGRHDECDLYLTGSDRLALRHLTVIVDPVTSWLAGQQAIQFRILDLRTRDGFSDEHGRQLRGLRCQGPAVLRCAGHVLFALPLGDPSDWPAKASDAWDCLPERVYFDEADHFPQGSGSRMPAIRERLVAEGTLNGTNGESKRGASIITRTHGPRDSSVAPLSEGNDVAGVLELIGPSFRETIKIGHDALRDGVLLGRYARCDGAGGLTDDATLSRVHALMIQLGDAILIVDTASSNGTWSLRDGAPEKPRARVFQLDGSTELRLGKTTRARWSWTAS
jgi:hypothetical protein